MVKGSRRPAGPIGLLGVLFLADCLLTFLWIDPAWRWALFLVGMVLPLVLFARRESPAPGAKGPWETEFLSLPPAWVLLGLLLLALGLRFYRIDSLFLWPTGDEGLIGEAAWEASLRWDGRFFHTAGQNPPLFVWLCALFWRVSGDPFLVLWGPAALVSCWTLLAGHLALREFTSRSFAWTFTGLLAFSFWPLTLGRRCLPAVLPPLGEFILLFCLVRFLKAPSGKKVPWAFLAGACAGAQSLTYVSWPVVFLAAVGLFLLIVRTLPGGRTKVITPFVLGSLLGLLPFILAFHEEGYGQHIQALGHQTEHYRYGGVGERIHRYGEALLFRLPGTLADEELGKPGGLLNPILGPFFLLGLVGVWRRRRDPYLLALGACLFWFLLPGVLSLNLQTFRVVQLLPLLLAVTVLGIGRCVEALPRKGPRWVLAAVLALSCVLDIGRLMGSHSGAQADPGQLALQGKSSARYRAHQEWKEWSKRLGPGIVLGEWDLWADRTLGLLTLPFNACRNPVLREEDARWSGILVDARYGTHLRKAFPRAEWKVLEGDLSGATFLMGTFAVGAGDRARVLAWARADRAFRNVNWAVDHVLDKDVLERMERAIREDHPWVAGDPLLESLYWEKVAEFYYYHGGKLEEHLKALEFAVGRGVPVPHLSAKLKGLRSLVQGGGSADHGAERPKTR
jgi:hypothetical protein